MNNNIYIEPLSDVTAARLLASVGMPLQPVHEWQIVEINESTSLFYDSPTWILVTTDHPPERETKAGKPYTIEQSILEVLAESSGPLTMRAVSAMIEGGTKYSAVASALSIMTTTGRIKRRKNASNTHPYYEYYLR